MSEQPSLHTARLTLRPFTLDDAPRLQAAAGHREIADTMISIPHPYVEGMAAEWIGKHAEAFASGKATYFAVQAKQKPEVIGAIELRKIDREHSQAEMSFWIGVECWGKGYAFEAAQAVIRYAFDELGLNRVYAFHMVRNPASGRILEKVGFKREGLLRQRVRKWGVYEDVVLMAILRQDWSGDADWSEST